MPRTQEKRPRASNGRFVKRTRASSKMSAGSATGGSPQPVSADQSEVVARTQSRREDSVRLALLTLAILCAALGFASAFFWIAALVLMGVLWGAMLAERPRRQETVRGLVTEMVTAVVDEARDVTDVRAETGAAGPAGRPPTTES